MKSCVSGFVFVFRCFWMDYYQCLIFGQFSRPDILGNGERSDLGPLNLTLMAEKTWSILVLIIFQCCNQKKGFVGAHLYKCSLQNFVLHKRVKNTGCASKLSLIVQQCRIRSCCSEWGWGPYKLTFVLSLTFPPYVAFTKVRLRSNSKLSLSFMTQGPGT